MGQVHRRRYLFASCAALAAALMPSLAAGAQKAGRTYRIAVFFNGGTDTMQPYRGAIRERLAEMGFMEGRNLRMTWRAATEGRNEDRRAALELVAAKPDAIVAFSSAMARAVQLATRSIPIVFVQVSDPIADGIVTEYAHPGGNATGVSMHHRELLAKRFQILRELLPNAKRVALFKPYETDPSYAAAKPIIVETARRLNFELLEVQHSNLWAIEHERAEGIIIYSVLGQRLTTENIIDVASRLRIPSVFPDAESVARGGLTSYGTDPLEDTRLGADILGRILNGAKPGNQPVQQNSRFILTINLKTARALGLKIPQPMLIRAEAVIE